MKEQSNIDFLRISNAIEYIKNNYRKHPSLEEIASNANVSPFHFQRLFTEWAGISPKKFIHYLSIEHAKSLLKENSLTLFDTSQHIGLSSTSRLHDMFLNIEGMTPAEYKNEAKDLLINYNYYESVFGKLIIATTKKGVCYISFDDNEEQAFQKLFAYFPKANFEQTTDELQLMAMRFFSTDINDLPTLKLHLKGSEFQLKVWNALLSIPMGKLSTYGAIAELVNNKKAARAVGSAIGDNPIAFLIPCHRVIQQSGILGGYMWGVTRKQAMIAWESAQVYK